MSSQSRRNPSYRSNASKLHIEVGEMLFSSPYTKSYRIYQEYPVKKICPKFKSGKEKFDWVILDLQLVIECHGEQHYTPICFGGISLDEAKLNFKKQQVRDRLKKEAALSVGWSYMVFKYDEPITIVSLIDRFLS